MDKDNLYYEKLGFKAGLEIHQQLDTQRLFSRTPSSIRPSLLLDAEFGRFIDDPDIIFRRFLRASAGEQGEIDRAALHEQSKQKYFLYQGYRDSDSLVEFDEEPIANIDQTALKFAAKCCTELFKAFVPGHLAVMRKTVVDGSNTSGFQRTVLIGMDGAFEVDGKRIGINTICLEEDSAKLVERTPDYDTYNLSRLGVPLLEIATAPDITNPKQLSRVSRKICLALRRIRFAAKFGEFYKSTFYDEDFGNLDKSSKLVVKRGLGSIRQDVNVSIKDGARVEIKGAQNLRVLSRLAKLEAERQHKLLLLKDEFKKKKVTIGTTKNITKLFSASSSAIVKKGLQQNDCIIALKLKNAHGLIGKELIPRRRLGTELADYVKVVAGLQGIMHSDELPVYGVKQKEKDAVAKVLGCNSNDAFLFVIGTPARVTIALDAIKERINYVFIGVPSEVRKALLDGTTSYLRPMSGSSRLYPETDAKLIVLPSQAEVVKSFNVVPEDISGLGLKKEIIDSLLRQEKLSTFMELMNIAPDANRAFVAEILLTYPKVIQQQFQESLIFLEVIFFGKPSQQQFQESLNVFKKRFSTKRFQQQFQESVNVLQEVFFTNQNTQYIRNSLSTSQNKVFTEPFQRQLQKSLSVLKEVFFGKQSQQQFQESISFLQEVFFTKQFQQQLKESFSVLHKGSFTWRFQEHLRKVFEALNKEEITKQSIFPILVDVAKTGRLDIAKFAIISDSELKEKLKKIVTKHKSLPLNALMGKAMAKLSGKADAKKILALLKEMKEK